MLLLASGAARAVLDPECVTDGEGGTWWCVARRAADMSQWLLCLCVVVGEWRADRRAGSSAELEAELQAASSALRGPQRRVQPAGVLHDLS